MRKYLLTLKRPIALSTSKELLTKNKLEKGSHLIGSPLLNKYGEIHAFNVYLPERDQTITVYRSDVIVLGEYKDET